MSSGDEPPPYSQMRPRRARKLLRQKWGDEYKIKAPRFWSRRRSWSALARATGELATAADPDELADAVMRHYVARIAVEYHKRVAREERERPPPPAWVFSCPKPRIPERAATRGLRLFPSRLSMADAGVRRPDDWPGWAGLA